MDRYEENIDEEGILVFACSLCGQDNIWIEEIKKHEKECD